MCRPPESAARGQRHPGPPLLGHWVCVVMSADPLQKQVKPGLRSRRKNDTAPAPALELSLS